MNHRAYGGFVDAEAERNRADQHAHFVRHPAFLIAPPVGGLHLAVIGNGGNPDPLEKIRRLFHPRNRRRIHNNISVFVTSQGAHEQIRLRAPITCPHDVAQIGPVEAGDIFFGIAELELVNDVVPHAFRCARCECRERAVGKMDPQAAQLAVVRTKFVSPLRDAVRFIDGEE